MSRFALFRRWLGLLGVASLILLTWQGGKTYFWNHRWERRIAHLKQVALQNDARGQLAQIALHPTKVEAFRLNPTMIEESLVPVIGNANGFDFTAKRTGLSSNFALRVGALTLDPSIENENGSTCTFHAGLGFRVWKGKQWVHVVVCPRCRQYMLLEPQAPLETWALERSISIHRAFSGNLTQQGRAEFLALAREAFPNDKTLPQS